MMMMQQCLVSYGERADSASLPSNRAQHPLPYNLLVGVVPTTRVFG